MKLGATFSISQFRQGNLHIDTQRRGPCEHGGRDRSDASISQEMLSIARGQQKLGRRQGRQRIESCQYLDFGVLAPRTGREEVSVGLSHLICDTLFWQPSLTTRREKMHLPDLEFECREKQSFSGKPTTQRWYPWV